MKKTELKEIRSLDIKKINEKIKDAKKELADLTLERSGQVSVKGAKDIKRIFNKRKDIAQMFTVMRQKELLEELGLKAAVSEQKSADTSEVKSEPKSKEDTSEVSEVKSKKTRGKDSGQARMTNKKKGQIK